jgi:YVTN family beta-propeller protein
MSINFHNNWITPADFEAPVNQGHEIVGADGKVESDQQNRGFRWWNAGGGSRTANNHFTREVARPDGSRAYVAAADERKVVVVDLKSLTVTGQVAAGGGPDGMAWVR